MAADGILAGKHAIGERLAHYDDGLFRLRVEVVEITAPEGRNVESQDVARGGARPCGLHGDERCATHAGGTDEDQRSGNLAHGEEAGARTGAAREADAASGRRRSVRKMCRWQTADISNKNGAY